MRRKTTLYLDPDLEADLDRVARARGVSKAELIRAALREHIGAASRPLVRAIGVGRGPGDVAENVDRHLRDTGFGDD